MAREQSKAQSSYISSCCGEIHLLSDVPVREDEFGAHGALAEAIARLIENEDGGKAITLEGAWGSGKSTVIELLKDRLKGGGKGKVFVFDGWAHEGDSLRRTLTEEFKQWVEKENERQPGWSRRMSKHRKNGNNSRRI